jgi:hypothetical protein
MLRSSQAPGHCSGSPRPRRTLSRTRSWSPLRGTGVTPWLLLAHVFRGNADSPGWEARGSGAPSHEQQAGSGSAPIRWRWIGCLRKQLEACPRTEPMSRRGPTASPCGRCSAGASRPRSQSRRLSPTTSRSRSSTARADRRRPRSSSSTRAPACGGLIGRLGAADRGDIDLAAGRWRIPQTQTEAGQRDVELTMFVLIPCAGPSPPWRLPPVATRGG